MEPGEEGCAFESECHDVEIGGSGCGDVQSTMYNRDRQNRTLALVDEAQSTLTERSEGTCGWRTDEAGLLRIEADYAFRNDQVDEVLLDSQDQRLVVGAAGFRRVDFVRSSHEDTEAENSETVAAAQAAGDIESGMSTQAVHGSTVDTQSRYSAEEEEEGEEEGDRESQTDRTGQMFYPRLALFQRQLLPESAWEADDATAVCHQCSRRFTLFLRRHHCRRCGLVFCDTCSQRRILLAAPVTPAQGGGYYNQQPAVLSDDDLPLAHHLYAGAARAMCWRFHEHRACDACAEATDRLPTAGSESIALVAVDSEASGAAENAYNIFGDPGGGGGRHQRSTSSGGGAAHVPMRRQQSSSSISVCPVCTRDWATVWSAMARVPGEGWPEAQERHIRACIEDTSAEMQGGTRHRQQGDARRSRSVQGRDGPPHTSAVTDAQPVPEMNRRSVGFLGFFDRTPPRDSASLDAVRHAIAASQPSAADVHSARAARSPMGVRYVSYKLTGDTPLLGQECPICFEDFEPGQRVARLNCLCTYHQSCINDWLQRTPACPVHYE